MHPIELDAILKLAKTKLRAGQIPEAEAMYRKALAEQPRCAEALHFLGLSAMRRGKLPEALDLVRQSVAIEPGKADYHNNLAMVLGGLNRPTEALGAAQQAIDLNDDFADAYGNKGMALERLGRLDEAIEAYRRAVEIREDYAEALASLGDALSRQGNHEEAIKRLKRAAELRPRGGEFRKKLGNALRKAGKSGQAVIAYRMAIELDPRDADAYNNLGAALQESGKVKDAAEVLRTCLSINPNHTDAHWNLGLALLALGNWKDGWVEYEWRRHLREDLGQKRGFPQPVWPGSPPDGKTILVLCEQGLGDTIQFIRYVPLLIARGAQVIVECQSKLRPLLMGLMDLPSPEGRGEGEGEKISRGFPSPQPSPDGRGGESPNDWRTNYKVIARGEPLPNFDLHARLMTLPCICGSTPDSLPNRTPYLSVDEKRIERFHEELSGIEGFKVGLVWQGSTAHKGDRFRSIALEMFKPLSQVPGVRLISLQKGYGSEQVEKNAEMDIHEWSDPTDTTAEALVDTAAVMKSLDLVIAVDTSLAHLAGALGVPVWVAMPLACDWRWLAERQDSPWYPTMRLFRQQKQGDWETVIARMAEELAELSASKDQPAAAMAAV